MWNPRTSEDRLIAQYLRANPGLLFLEVEVGQGDEQCGPRRLDGLLIPGGETHVRAQSSYRRDDIAAAVQGQHVHVLEAKRKLNRTVIGQVQVGMALFRRDFSPASAQGVAVCAFGNPDLEWYCLEQGIQTALYPVDLPPKITDGDRSDDRVDRRKPPDPGRRQAFMRGWDAAVAGTLYGSVHVVKTHANMGNLFGWIYGDMSEEFRDETWARYVENLGGTKTWCGDSSETENEMD
ncbi:hypothetical protein [Desulfonatronum parangueonense]